MFLSSCWAVALRHTRLIRRDPNYIIMILFWPLLDVLPWGFLGTWLQQSQAASLHNYHAAALLGVLLWQVVGRGGSTIFATFNEELWTHNLVNLFSLPLRIGAWMCGVTLFFMLMMAATSACSLLVIYCLYDVSIWYLVTTGLVFLLPLLLSSIWLGFMCLQVVLKLGKRGAELGWAIMWVMMPFSGAFYPLDVLPHWGQVLSSWLPMSYVFQAMRGQVMYGKDPTALLVKGYLLGALYAAVAIVGFVYAFNRSKRKGLARLAD